MIQLAGKIPKDTRDAIIRAYKNGGRSKAQLARDYEVSVTSVNRILNEMSAKIKSSSGNGLKKQARPSDNSMESVENSPPPLLGSKPGIAMKDAEKALSAYGELLGGESIDSLVQEFASWISKRDKGEKELISIEMSIEALKHEKSSLEDEISRLGSKAGSLEILIGRMKRLAEDSQMDLSLVEERLSNIEEKLSIDHDILLIGSAIRMILKGEELDEELVSMIADISRFNSSDADSKKETVRRALMEYSQFFRRRISTS